MSSIFVSSAHFSKEKSINDHKEFDNWVIWTIDCGKATENF